MIQDTNKSKDYTTDHDGVERREGGTKRSRRGVPIHQPLHRRDSGTDDSDADYHAVPLPLLDRKRPADQGPLHDSTADTEVSDVSRRNSSSSDHDDADSVEDINEEEVVGPVISTPSSSTETTSRPKPLTSLLRDVRPFHSPAAFASLPRRGSGDTGSRDGARSFVGEETEQLRRQDLSVNASSSLPPRTALRLAGLSHLLARKESERTASTAESFNEGGIRHIGENQLPHRRRRRPSRPGAIHVTGRAYGPPPAWGMRRLLQEHGLGTPSIRATSHHYNEEDEEEDPPMGLDAHLANERGLEMPSCNDGVSALDVVDISDLDDGKDEKEASCRHYLVLGFVCGAATMIVLILTVVLLESGPFRKSVSVVGPAPSALPSAAPSTSPTMVPTYANWGEYIDVVSEVTSRSELEHKSESDDKSPQRRALDWMLKDSQYSLDNPLFLQRYAMAVFFYATDGENWPTTNFLRHETSECTWEGVRCDDPTSHVIGIHRGGANNRLKGQLPSELSALHQLKELVLTGNSLTGTIPSEYGSLKNLKLLTLPRNQLKGPLPKSFEHHENLEVISLQENVNFGGSVPYMELQTMGRLREFYCRDCDLAGTLPWEWFALDAPLSLEVLQLDHNELSGTLPTGLGRLSKLKTLLLNNNYLSGTIPKEWYMIAEGEGDKNQVWPKLQTLNLSRNQFTGAPLPPLVPSHLPLWGRFRDQLSVDLSWNWFTGTISEQFANMQHLEALHLDGNDFKGTMPQKLCNLFETGVGNLSELSVDKGEVDCQCCTCCP